MNYKKPTVWLVVISMLLSLLLAGCFLTDPVQEQSQEELSVSREDQEKIDALVNQICTKLLDRGYDSLHPDWYRIIDTKARQELMDYGDTALEYMVNQLRTTSSSNHSVREQIMVYLCDDMAKAIPAESRYSGQWSEIPGMWLTYYDMKNADKDDQSILQPGFYQITDVIYGEVVNNNSTVIPGEMATANTVYWDYGRRYMVTEKGFFIRVTKASYTFITTTNNSGDTIENEFRIRHTDAEYTSVLPVDWCWKSSGKQDDLWSKLSSQDRDEYKEHLGLSDLVEEKDYLYQTLDENHCLIQTGSGLYTNIYLIGQLDGKLQYVYEIDKTV